MQVQETGALYVTVAGAQAVPPNASVTGCKLPLLTKPVNE